jgi:uncharacterized membrane protein
MPIGSIVWGAPDWALPALAIAIVIALLSLWSYGTDRARSSLHLLSLLLKWAAVGLLALCLLDPMQSGTRPKPQANLMPILVDNSQSMTMRSSEGEATRGDRVKSLLDESQDWRVRLAQDYDVRPYQFASRLEPMPSAAMLTMDGSHSSLASSLLALKERLRGRPIAGVVVFTDGNLTDDRTAQTDWSNLGFPVYPVVPFNEEAPGDLRITDVSVTQSDFETAPVSVRVTVASQALPAQDVWVRLEDQMTHKVIAEQSVALNKKGEAQSTTIKFRPEKPGVGFYRVVVFREADRAMVATSSVTSEATFANNSRWLAIDRGKGPHRILYISGRPNWDFKFIRRAVQSDPEVKLVGLLRIANKESKFTFRDRDVSSTNPLFAGLGEDEEEAAQQYDEPVMLRLGVEVSDELSDGFPRLTEELFGYEAVILDDLEAAFFSPEQLLMLRQFVAFRGGGLLMLGGQESFDANRFAASPLGELSPVYSARRDEDRVADSFRMELTREGLLQPWIRLRETEDGESQRLQSMPSFNTRNPVGEAKPGAIQLATLRDQQGRALPGLVVQRFGKGKSAALTLGDSWKWSMRREPGAEDEPARLWRQIMRWLVNDVPQRAQSQIEVSDSGDGQVTIRTQVRDESFMPLDNAKVEIEVTPITDSDGKPTKPVSLVAQDDPSSAGTYKTTYFASQPGGYLASAKVTAEDGSDIATTQAGWAAQPGEAEFRQWEINRDFLQTLADQTGGMLVDDRKLDRFVTELKNRKVPVEQVWTYPLWHQPWVMLLAIMCLCGEWGLRRWKGLP